MRLRAYYPPLRIRSFYLSKPSIFLALIGCVWIGIFASGCTRSTATINRQWTYSDLRLVDGIDASASAEELIAVYERIENGTAQIRLDILDVSSEQPINLYLAFDIMPGGSGQFPIMNLPFPDDYRWDVLVCISADSTTIAYDDAGNIIRSESVRISRDTFLDAIIVALPVDMLLSTYDYRLVVVTTSVDGRSVDVLGPISANSPPPPPIPIMLAFWDTFQSISPAQALRSWDGAHAGPDSGRHGLKHLMDSVQEYNIPIALVGFDYQLHYPALVYLGVEHQFVGFFNEGLLFYGLECELGIVDYAHYRYLEGTYFATPNGLSKEAIIQILLSSTDMGSESTMIIGSSFRKSTWGLPDAVSTTLDYIARHPWLRVMNHVISTSTGCESIDPASDYKIVQMINSVKPNRLTDLAEDTFLMLAKNDDPVHAELRSRYIRQIGHILSAASWTNSPHPITDCSKDIDLDNEVECILATEQIFTTYELLGGYLAFGFFFDGKEPHQIIGPTYQLAVGLSDPTEWNLREDLYADPAQILGAFADSPTQSESYKFELSDGLLQMVSSDMSMRKDFGVTDQTITMQVSSRGAYPQLSIPFVIDPWTRFQPEWVSRYSISLLDSYWLLSVVDEISIQVNSSETFNANSFLASWSEMDAPEDPNFDYSLGYFLPFPLMLLEVNPTETFTTSIRIIP